MGARQLGAPWQMAASMLPCSSQLPHPASQIRPAQLTGRCARRLVMARATARGEERPLQKGQSAQGIPSQGIRLRPGKASDIAHIRAAMLREK